MHTNNKMQILVPNIEYIWAKIQMYTKIKIRVPNMPEVAQDMWTKGPLSSSNGQQSNVCYCTNDEYFQLKSGQGTTSISLSLKTYIYIYHR